MAPGSLAGAWNRSESRQTLGRAVRHRGCGTSHDRQRYLDVAFTPSGALIVDGTSNTIHSYHIERNQSLQTITDALPTEGLASCWSVISPNGRLVYTDNAGTSNQSGFAIGANGSLTPLGNTIVSSNPDNSGNLDIAVSSDGRFLYTLNAATGSIGVFSVQRDGGLVDLDQVDGLPASAGLNGIAAY